MKLPTEWNEDDLLQVIDSKVEENLLLEFKRADALQPEEACKREVSKDVSAFANSAGGTIVYGMEESPKAPHIATALSPVDPAAISKEWLEQVIHSRIQPRVHGLTIRPIRLEKTHAGKFVYIVVVPESATAHQASDKKYYKRYNFQSVPMEDYEVRQTMNRASRPAYEMSLRASKISVAGNSKQFEFTGTLENKNDIVGHEVSAVLFLPKSYVAQADEYATNYQGQEYSRIPGSYAESSMSLRSVIEAVPPLTPYQISFRRTVLIPHLVDFDCRAFVVLVKVFDQFGIALESRFRVQPPHYEISLLDEKHAAKRAVGSRATEIG